MLILFKIYIKLLFQQYYEFKSKENRNLENFKKYKYLLLLQYNLINEI